MWVFDGVQFATIRSFQKLATVGFPDAAPADRLDAYWLVSLKNSDEQTCTCLQYVLCGGVRMCVKYTCSNRKLFFYWLDSVQLPSFKDLSRADDSVFPSSIYIHALRVYTYIRIRMYIYIYMYVCM